MQKILEVDALSVAFAPIPGPVLRSVSFSLYDGNRLAVIGPSGCGKTTLLRALSGLLKALPLGVICWDKEVVLPIPVVWQDIRLFPWLSVRDNLEYVVKLRRSVGSCSPMELLASVGMEWAANLWPGQLSRGQAQRVALARCLATGSKLIFLDEPFASLDAITRRRMGQLLLELAAARSLSYILVTHDTREALVLADRILVLTAAPASVAAEISRKGGQFDPGTENYIWKLLDSSH